ncbi:MAG: hypothetical protein IPM39_02705 [Chloroflexi bacterium]|nr:hypothetical protein [Chloroflexota bacterium]
MAQFDGWPTALTGLESGDIIAQPVTLIPALDTPPGDYVVRLGLYSPQSGQRLPLAAAPGDAADTASQSLRIFAVAISDSVRD